MQKISFCEINNNLYYFITFGDKNYGNITIKIQNLKNFSL